MKSHPLAVQWLTTIQNDRLWMDICWKVTLWSLPVLINKDSLKKKQALVAVPAGHTRHVSSFLGMFNFLFLPKLCIPWKSPLRGCIAGTGVSGLWLVVALVPGFAHRLLGLVHTGTSQDYWMQGYHNLFAWPKKSFWGHTHTVYITVSVL